MVVTIRAIKFVSSEAWDVLSNFYYGDTALITHRIKISTSNKGKFIKIKTVEPGKAWQEGFTYDGP